ncbi:MAG: hypothetical protein E7373_06535 [Clostridiales bacterium]|nr:hypothetical protein [Clostridiales bacterium]
MKTVEDKYLIVTQFDTIDARCSECSTAGIKLYNCSSIYELVSKISEFTFCANVKVLGMYKKIDTLTIDKNCNLRDK